MTHRSVPGGDPILTEVIKHELAAVSDEIGDVISKTGRSQMVKAGDFAAMVFDGRARMIGVGKAPAFQQPLFIEVMAHVQERWAGQLRPGDVIVSNDPYKGMGHLPDIAVITPCFWKDELVAYLLTYSHHIDIGGRFAGGFSSRCESQYEEGLCLSLVKLYDEGRRNEALMDTILANVRAPKEWAGDLEAKVTGCWRGEKELGKVLDRYGLDAFRSCCDYLIDYSERATREAISGIPDGDYYQEGVFEDEEIVPDGKLMVRVRLGVVGDELSIDFAGTSPQVGHALNLPLGMTAGVARGALGALVGADVLLNTGFARPIHLIAPLGCVVNPRPPAAVGGRAPLAFVTADVVFRALAKALPDRMPVIGEGADVLHFSGTDSDGRPFIGMDNVYGGWGGRPTKDGIDGVTPVHFGSSGTPSVELLEREFPVMVEGFGFVPDTGGAGEHRGSVSVYRQWRFLAPAQILLRSNRLNASEGLKGGHAGGLSRNVLNPEREHRELPRRSHLHLDVQAGDSIQHVVCGSGGHGDPRLRDPLAVLQDVRAEKLTILAARDQYGVAIDPGSLVVDADATATLRASAVDGPHRVGDDA